MRREAQEVIMHNKFTLSAIALIIFVTPVLLHRTNDVDRGVQDMNCENGREAMINMQRKWPKGVRPENLDCVHWTGSVSRDSWSHFFKATCDSETARKVSSIWHLQFESDIRCNAISMDKSVSSPNTILEMNPSVTGAIPEWWKVQGACDVGSVFTVYDSSSIPGKGKLIGLCSKYDHTHKTLWIYEFCCDHLW